MSQDDQNGMSDDEKLAAEWAAQVENETEGASDGVPTDVEKMSDDERLAQEWANALADDEEKELSKSGTFAPQTQSATFKDLTETSKSIGHETGRRELDFILDIPLDVSAELGRTRLLISELLQLGQGSVVELNKLAGEPLEVFVNGKLVAKGEAVVINEKFGVRLTDIISPIERVKQLS